jgi:hypothetical protein
LRQPRQNTAIIFFPADLVGVALDELPADTRIMAEAHFFDGDSALQNPVSSAHETSWR